MGKTKEEIMKTTEEFDIEIVLENLKNKVEGEFKRPFCSEAEFQFELALMIKDTCKDVEKIYLEFPFKKDNETKHLDILVVVKKEIIPIELKYKTKEKSTKETKYNTELYQGLDVPVYLKNQGAKNLGCFYFIKDIERIEDFKKNEEFKKIFKEGYAIMLTNDESYLKPPRKNKKGEDPDYAEFSLHPFGENKNERTIGDKEIGYKELKWKINTENNNKYGTAKIEGKYLINWREAYLNFEKDIFNILKIEIKQ